MNNLERLDLINLIAVELQQRMTFRDIDAYLPGFGVDVSKPYSGANSKWVYTKEMLADAPAGTVLAIADELQIPHSFSVTPGQAVIEASCWKPNTFRLFLSHISDFKKKASALQAALTPYGISSFVAHVDIEPTKKWLDEIEAALFSMDAMAALLVDGFKSSNWTDHEVGIAVGRGVLIVPVMRGLTPYGFIAKYQGLNASGKSVGQVAELIYRVLVRSPQSRSRMLTCLVDQAVSASSDTEALTILKLLGEIEDLPFSQAERLKSGAERSPVASSSRAVESSINSILAKHGVAHLGKDPFAPDVASDQEIPF